MLDQQAGVDRLVVDPLPAVLLDDVQEVVLIQPTKRSKQKTDHRDAGELSHLLWVHRQQFREGRRPLGLRRVQPPTPQEADDRQITALRAGLTKKRTAVLNGINLIDTAINYRYQTSEREIGEALKELFSDGSAVREQLVVTSKAGFLPLDFPFPENPYQWIDEHVLVPGLATKEEVVVDQHCITPAYLRWSVEQSLKNLQLETIDVFFLHNPDMQLGYVEYKTLKKRIKKAFELFEKLVEEGKITTEEAERLSTDLIESGSRQWHDMQEKISGTVRKALEGMDICTRQDCQVLAEKVAVLKKRVAALEQTSHPTGK